MFHFPTTILPQILELTFFWETNELCRVMFFILGSGDFDMTLTDSQSTLLPSWCHLNCTEYIQPEPWSRKSFDQCVLWACSCKEIGSVHSNLETHGQRSLAGYSPQCRSVKHLDFARAQLARASVLCFPILNPLRVYHWSAAMAHGLMTGNIPCLRMAGTFSVY